MDEVSFKPHDELEILAEGETNEWVVVRKADGECGLAPRLYIAKRHGMEPWKPAPRMLPTRVASFETSEHNSAGAFVFCCRPLVSC